MKSALQASLGLLLLLCLVSGARAQRISEAMQKEDERLSAKVTFVGRQVYVGELLEAVSKQAKIKLEALDEDGAAGEEIVVHLPSVSAAEVMNALHSLLSYKGAGWVWERSEGEDGEWSYRLKRPKSVDSLARDIKNTVQQSFEAHASAALAAVQTYDPQNKPDLDELTQAAVAQERTRRGLKLFLQLPEETRTKILRGEQVLQVTVDSLSPAGQELARGLFDADNPQTVTFTVKTPQGAITPTFFVVLDNGGYGYLGGVPLAKVWDRQIKEGWMLRSDATAHTLEKDPLGADTQDSTGKPGQNAESFPARFLRLARRNSVALLCRYPSDERVESTSPESNPTLGSMLAQFESDGYIHKWHGNVLLIMSHNAVVTAPERNQRVRWNTVKQLRRESLSDPDRLLPAAALFQAASESTDPAFTRMLFREFENTRVIPKTQPLLAWFAADPARFSAAFSAQGITISPALSRLLQDRFRNLDALIVEKIAAGKITRVRLAQERRAVQTGSNEPSVLQAHTTIHFREGQLERRGFIVIVGRCLAAPKKKAGLP